jgi:hypoxanthine phosphoribosyltransferase
MRRKVITLNYSQFEHHCYKLEELVRAENFCPDMVVGIRTGGLLIAELMFSDVPHSDVTLRRPSTKAKFKFLNRIFHAMPYRMLDCLRIFEAWMLNCKQAPQPRDISNIVIEDAVRQARNILIVDDAVDSGQTLEAATRAIRQAAPTAEVRTAAITVTTNNPMVMPDTFIYNNLTLIRFPWSLDMKI